MDICDKDNLPFPILDMLSFINQKGPLTEGVFRKSANIKSCRVLKKKLNSGVKVNPYSESVHVVASVLKDFLRNIQGSIFLSDLYDKWLSVIDQGNKEEKITAAQRLLAELPRANVVLLRYLFGVLYNIEQHSSSNQMTAYNLSVCIAPSVLYPRDSGSLELEDNLIRKDAPLWRRVPNPPPPPPPPPGSGRRAAGAGCLGRQESALKAVMVERPAEARRWAPPRRRSASALPGAPRQGAAQRGASGLRRAAARWRGR
ncbi:rho GTPase-activating protein 20-like [Mirounga angustirostris]|uniref:rho GTPase-activating protein 20-like n=2 Tax=Mirounga angustirostris TaxID=9716 RepID=UPI00313BF71A